MPGNDGQPMTPLTRRLQPETSSGGPRPRVSIVVPVHNGERFIAEALSSALGQSFTDFELVVVDNASTDGTVGIVNALVDERVRLIVSSVNDGAGANWNRAVVAARGEYVKLLCADDVLESTCIERQLEAFAGAAGDSVALVCSRRRVIDGLGRTIIERGFEPHLRGRVSSVKAARRVAWSGTDPIGEPAAVLFRREDAVRAGLFRENAGYVIDLDLWLRLLLLGDLFVVDEVLARFRVSSGSWSVLLARHQADQYRGLLEQVAADGRLGLRRRDVALGSAVARILSTARRLLYLWLARRDRRDGP